MGERGAERAVGSRLSVMMFLQFAVWGAWLPIVARYLDAHLGFSPLQIGIIVGTAGATGAITAPFIAGQIADRFFPAERFMAVLMIAGGVVKWILAGLETFPAWLALSIAYSVIYMPTLALANSLAFAHLRDPDGEFPPIRVWGTIGWIVVSWVFPMAWLQTGLELQAMPPFLKGVERPDAVARLADALRLASILSVGYGLYCLTLPHTPPRRHVESIAFARAFGLLRHRGLLVVTLVALPIAVIHTIYFLQTPQFLPTLAGVRTADIQPAMSIGQFSEIAVLAVLGLLLRRLGFRWVLAIGCLAYVGRYFVFGIGEPTPLVLASQALHGLCYGCFFAGAFIYVERVAPADVRHSAQTVFGIVILGLGPILAGPVAGVLADVATAERTIAECAATANLVPQPPATGWPALYAGAEADMAAWAAAHPDDRAGSWRGLRDDAVVQALDYRRFWSACALIGLGCALALAALFRLDPPAAPLDAVLVEAEAAAGEAPP